MPTTFPLDTNPQQVAASLANRKVISVGSGSTVYFSTTDRNVTPVTNEGSIALKGSMALTQPTWFASAGQSRVLVTENNQIARANGAGETDTSGVFHDLDVRSFGELDPTGARGASSLLNQAITYTNGFGAPISFSIPRGSFLLDAPLTTLSPTAGLTIKTAGRSSTQFVIPSTANFHTFFRVTTSDVTIEPCTLSDQTDPPAAIVANDNGFVQKGTWDATANTPTLVNATGTVGDCYRVTVAGTHNFGAGNITFAVGDRCYYTGSVWAQMGNPYAILLDGGFRFVGDFYFDGVPGCIEMGPTGTPGSPEIRVKGTWDADFGLPWIKQYRGSGLRIEGNLQGRGTVGFPQCGMAEIEALTGIDGGHWNVASQYIPTGAKADNGGYLYGEVHDATIGKIVNQDRADSTFDHACLFPTYVKSNGGTEEYRYNLLPKRLTPDRGQQHTRGVCAMYLWNGVGSPLEANSFADKSMLVGGAARAAVISAGNKVSTVRVNADGGTFTAGVDTGGGVQNTGAIAFDAYPDAAYTDAGYAATFQAKLEALGNVGTGNVRVFGGVGAGGGDGIPFFVIFCGTLGASNTPVLTINGAGLTLAGGTASVTTALELTGQSTTTVRDWSMVETRMTGAITGSGVPHREALITVMAPNVSLTGNRFSSSGDDSVARTTHFVEVLSDFTTYNFVGNTANLEGSFASFKTDPHLNTQVSIGNSPSGNDLIPVPSGLAADRPAGGGLGRLYYATDTPALYFYNGSSWKQVTLT